MLSLVPGYMVVSWTLRLPAVGMSVTCGVEGQPGGGGVEMEEAGQTCNNKRQARA